MGIVLPSTALYTTDIPTGKLSRYSELNIKNGAVTRDNKKNGGYITGNLWYVDITTGKIKPFQVPHSKHIGYIVNVTASYTTTGHSLISTYGNGLYAYELSTGNLQHFTFEVNQSSHQLNYLQFVMEDRSGGIWVSFEFSEFISVWRF